MLRHVLQNLALALPPVRALARRFHRTGAMNDPEEVARRAGLVRQAMDAAGVPLAGARLLEIGPGQTLGLGVALLLGGASELSALDTVAYASPGDPAPFLPIAARLGLDPGAVEPALKRLRYRIVEKDGRWPLEDGSADIVYSFSVLEHVRAVEALLEETRRVLRPGGLCLHSIDLRDHFHLAPGANWLRFLRYTDREWDLMTSRRSTWCNRLRAPEWRELLGRRFELLRFEKERLPLPQDLKRAPRFAGMLKEDLGVSMLWVVGLKASDR